MAEYIEREAAIAVINERKHPTRTPAQNGIFFDALRGIKDIPAADVAPVVHGRWINRTGPDNDLNVTDTCSRCLHTDTHSPTIDVPYCWHCGAKMDKEAT